MTTILKVSFPPLNIVRVMMNDLKRRRIFIRFYTIAEKIVSYIRGSFNWGGREREGKQSCHIITLE